MDNLIASEDKIPVIASLLAAKKSALTQAAYKSDLAAFGQFLGGEGKTVDLFAFPNNAEIWQQWLPTSTIAAYIKHLATTSSDHTGRPYATATQARKITSVKELLTEAMFKGLYPPTWLDYVKKRLKTPPASSDHHGGITPDEQDRLLKHAAEKPGLRGQRDYILFRLLLETGIRRAELVGLSVRDFITKEGIPTLRITHGKGDKSRDIGIEGDTAQFLKAWLTAAGQIDKPDHPIFCALRWCKVGDEKRFAVKRPDKHLNVRSINWLVEKYVEECAIESQITPHSFRVAFVTDLLADGAPLSHLQAVTGHSSPRVLTAIYDRNTYRHPVSKYRKRKIYKPSD